MTLMQLIKIVLDDAYAALPGEESEKDERVKNELSRLTPAFRNLDDPTRPHINYCDPLTRFAYIYKYTVAHADYIMQLIKSCNELGRVDNSWESLGG